MLELLTSGFNPFGFIKNNWRAFLFIVIASALVISGMWFYSHYTGLKATIENNNKTISEQISEISKLEKEQKRLVDAANSLALDNDRLASARDIDSKIVADLTREIAVFQNNTQQQQTKLSTKIKTIKSSTIIPESDKPKAISFELAKDIWMGYCEITVPAPSECPETTIEIKPSTTLQPVIEVNNVPSPSNIDFEDGGTFDHDTLELRPDRMHDSKDEDRSGLPERNQSNTSPSVLDPSVHSVDDTSGSAELQSDV
jgi:uncharacterized protein YoxC